MLNCQRRPKNCVSGVEELANGEREEDEKVKREERADFG